MDGLALLGFLLALMLTAGVPGSLAQVVGAPFNSARLAQLRGLAFKKPVPVVAITPEQAQQLSEQDLGRDYSEERLRADGIAGSMVGLFPPRFDLKSQILKQFLTQFGGVYWEHLKQIVLIARGADAFGSVEMTWVAFGSGFLGNCLAHELTHALQDQTYDLEGREKTLKDDDDRSTAFASVVEGDATLAAVAYSAGSLDGSVLSRLTSNLDGEARRIDNWARAGDIADGLSIPNRFAHTQGVNFVAEAYRRGGWRAIDALYAHPPVSTQQIINPELYFDTHRSPMAIQINGYQKLLPSAAVIHTNTYGELRLRIVLQRNLGGSAAQLAHLASHWAGDRMVILEQGGSITVIWLVAFDRPASAQEFATDYVSLLDRLHGTSMAHHVDRRGSAVLCVIGDGLRQHPELPSEVWQQTTISPPPASHP